MLGRVHASPTLELTTGQAALPARSWRLVEGETTGIPPCSVASLEFQKQVKLLRGSPMASVQGLAPFIADVGDEYGSMQQDGGLARLTRQATCCLSGQPAVLPRTGDLSSMSKYLRWERQMIIVAVVRVLDPVNGVPQLSIEGSKQSQRKCLRGSSTRTSLATGN